MKRFVETDLATMWLDKDILFFFWKERVSIDLSGAKETVAQRLRLQQGRPQRILCKFNGILHIEKEARHYLLGEGAELVQELVLIATTPLELAYSKYISNKMPLVPTKVFPDMDTAMGYLVQHG
ncbi:MAG: hypothetical protein CMH46_07620 [Muricauda sp.]|nr:hypothetical protein [Allomuricauda sp.]MAU15392.1 hypothetical protein [Allomuricauda sp.]|tara:strand:+ start:1105 stop:1476 length:372 start_codon:yes stop_codon:yes gene_type:complete